jgi:transposase
MIKFKPYQSNAQFVLPLRAGDLIPPDDLCWVVVDVVEKLDLKSIIDKYSYYGTDGYHPEMLLKLILYGVATGVRSSRKLARLASYDVRGIMLCGGQRPGWRTINRFIANHSENVHELFNQVLKICKSLGMVGFGHLAIDGTKVNASASKDKNKTIEGLEKSLARLDKEIQEALDQIQTNDQLEKDEEIPQEIQDQKTRREKIEEALNELKKRDQTDSKATPRHNRADPDSRLMNTRRNGYQQCYNNQIAVDDKNYVITACLTTQDGSDIHQMIPLLQASEANTGQKHEAVSADTGYFTGENLQYVQDQNIEGYICPEHDAGSYHKSKFKYDDVRDIYICPAGRELAYIGSKRKAKGKIIRMYFGDCTGCPNREKCVKSKTGNRQVERDGYDNIREEMRQKLKTDEGKSQYGKRKTIVEPVIGQIKTLENFRQHLRRGLAGAEAELGMVCIGHNIKRIWHYLLKCQVYRKAVSI